MSSAQRPPFFRLKFLPGSFATEWPEMPREVFRTDAAARFAALMFVKDYEAGAYSTEGNYWWARDSVGEGLYRLTQIVVVPV